MEHNVRATRESATKRTPSEHWNPAAIVIDLPVALAVHPWAAAC